MRVAYVAGVLAAAAVAALPAAPALATDIHKPLFQISEIPAEGPHHELIALPGRVDEHQASMTVDSGHVWIAGGASDIPNGNRVDVFDVATGTFISQFAHFSSSTPLYNGVAVGHLAGETEPQVYLAENTVVKVDELAGRLGVYSESGAKLGSWTGAGTPEKSFGPFTGIVHGSFISAIAVDRSKSLSDWAAGDVFVAALHVVDVFHPQAGATAEEKYVTQLTGISPTEQFGGIEGVTVNDLNGDLVVLEGGRLDLFEPTSFEHYAFVRTLTLPSSTIQFKANRADANDGEGDIYASGEVKENGTYQGQQVFEFNAAGEYKGRVPVPGSDRGVETTLGLQSATSVAGDPETHGVFVGAQNSAAGIYAFGPNIVVPDVTTDATSNPKTTSVTLNGTINPDGAGPAKCQFDWGKDTSYGQLAPCPEVPEGNTPVPVQVSLAGLEPDTTYHYRLQAGNANGTNPGEPWQDQQFTTPGPGVHGESVVDVAATSATFQTTINPNNGPTSFYFQYGTSSEYTQQAPAPPGQAIGSGNTEVLSNVHVQGLLPGTVYHYRVVVVSEVAPGDIEAVDGADHTFTTQAAGGGFSLADGRQWELVSPPSKLGALVEGSGSSGGLIQASADGNAIAYRASSPTESEPHGFARTETVLSMRGAGGWSSQDISSPHAHATHVTGTVGHEFQIFSEDLSHAAVQPVDSVFTPLSPQASESTSYLRDNQAGTYTPLVTGKAGFANVPPGTAFGEEPNGFCEAPTCGPLFQGASSDLSHVVLSSPVQLTSTPAPAGGEGLYEWSAGSLQLLDVLPKGEEGPAVLAGTGKNVTGKVGVRGSVSDDGERVLMEGGASGGNGLYLRDVAAGETIRLDVPQGASGPSEGVSYMDANGDASRVFFLDSGQLMAGSSPSGADLYEYNLNAPPGSRLSDLTTNPHAGQSANVAMMIGASKDSSYVYFAAGGALAPGAVEGECPREKVEIKEASRGCNLYLRREGVTRLVAVLPSDEVYDWSKKPAGFASFSNSSPYARVSPDGRWLAFMSPAELTGYDTHDAVSGQPDLEVYLYHAPTSLVAESGTLICASCDPTGARPVGALVEGNEKEGDLFDFLGKWVAGSVPPWTGSPQPGSLGDSWATHQPRYLSDSGRLFFDSTDALVPQDVNGAEDVYQYESAGVGTCSSSSATFASRSGGCVNLVSSGTSPVGSTFLDASETGSDVFFITQAQLASQDYDTAYDVYDAHECTSAPCLPVVTTPPPCSTESSCKASPTPQPAIFGAPASATFSGTGNLSPASTPVAKPKAAARVRVEKLAKALKACRVKHNSRKRSACEAGARKRYGVVKKAKKSGHAGRGGK